MGWYACRMNDLLTERFGKDIKGVISSYDRLVVFGSFDKICYPKAMEGYLLSAGVRLVDYQKHFANELRLEMVSQVKQFAEEQKVTIEHVQSSVRKEDFVAKRVQRRRGQPGVVCVLSAMESCRCFKVHKNHESGYLELRSSPGKCLHYYIYWIDEILGLCYLRIPTWAPFRLQGYCNGHDWLERQLKAKGITFRKADNCFVHIGDFEKAQKLAESFRPIHLHRPFNNMINRVIPAAKKYGLIQWSIYQAEWATDIVFKNDRVLPELYQEITRTAIHEVKCPDVYCFMGKRLTKRSKEAESRLQTLIEGTRIKHTLGATSVKMYDKQNRVLRIETTTSDVSSFSCYRMVASRNGTGDIRWAPIRKTIYSLGRLAEAMGKCNRRYLEFISGFIDRTAERHDLRAVTESVRDEKERSHRGVNFFKEEDLEFIVAISQGEHQINGIRNRALQSHLRGWKPAKIGRVLRRFRALGLIKKVANTTKYYLTKLGKDVLIAGLQLRERVVIPSFLNAQ